MSQRMPEKIFIVEIVRESDRTVLVLGRSLAKKVDSDKKRYEKILRFPLDRLIYVSDDQYEN